MDAASGGGDRRLFAPETDADRQALLDAQAAGSQPVTIDGQDITPGIAGLSASSIRNDVPTPLLITLVLLGLGGVALAVPGMRRALPLVGRRRALPFVGRHRS